MTVTTVAAMLPDATTPAPMKRLLVKPDLSPEERAERWAKLAAARQRHNDACLTYSRAYQAGRRFERSRLLKLFGIQA